MKKNHPKNHRSARPLALRSPALLSPLLCFALALLWQPIASGQRNTRPERATKAGTTAASRPIPDEVMLRVLRAEDERRWEESDLGVLLFDRDARVRSRAALAAGRIGDERAVAALISLLQNDKDANVRAMAAFALGETESATASQALVAQLSNKSAQLRGRVMEALGKVVAALPKEDEARGAELGAAILGALMEETNRSPKPDREVILLGLTAVLRARPANAGAVVARSLADMDWRVRADAANTLARLRSKDGVEKLRALLLGDANAVVRANAARALGAAENRDAFEALLNRSVGDQDERVRISAVRALGALKDARAAAPLLQRAAALTAAYLAAKTSGTMRPAETSELLEIAASLGRIIPHTGDERAVVWLRQLRAAEGGINPEVEIAFARIAPAVYLRESNPEMMFAGAPRGSGAGGVGGSSSNNNGARDWRQVSSLAQGLGDFATMTAEVAGSTIVSLQADAQITLRSMIDDRNLPALAVPDTLTALSAFKPNDLGDILQRKLNDRDVAVRATAAQLLAELQPDEASMRALAAALPAALRDEPNDAALAILDALSKQQTPAAAAAIRTALDSTDHLIRRRAIALLKTGNAGGSQARITPVQTNHTIADYQRTLARMGQQVRALVTTDKGSFTIELLPDDAPLTVDNFIRLARRGYFNNTSFHRVVPNFVAQGGDPRGDGNGGPGYQIRCEINEARYDRGAVGMALSGKDTGGSQWFITHSPQPHLDGGYTVFGRIVSGMEVVDRITRGDVIRTISVTENPRPASKADDPPRKTEKSQAGGTKKKRAEH